MSKTLIKISGFLSILFGVFWIALTLLGFVYLLSNGESGMVQADAVVKLCNIFINCWFNPAKRILNFESAPQNTDIYFWCILMFVVMIIFIIAGIRFAVYAKPETDFSEKIGKVVMLAIFDAIMLAFFIHNFVQLGQTMVQYVAYINFAVLGLLFALPVAQCIRAQYD